MPGKKLAIVTGAGRGIGRAICVSLAGENYAIAALARNEAELAETGRSIAEAAPEILVSLVACDVSDPAQVQSAFARCEAMGEVQLLVNNAGFAQFRPFIGTDWDTWRTTIDVNLHGVYHCTQAVLPGMIARRSGRIINIASVAGLKGIEDQSAYCASKHALVGLTKVLAMELKEHGIAVHAVCPGGVQTRLAAEAMPHRDQSDWMRPEDIAEAVVYLARLSPRAAVDLLQIRRFDSTPV